MPKNSQPLLGELQKLSPGSGTGRLTTVDEQRGAGLFRDLVLAGGKALGSALQLAAELPWYVSVAGTVEAWPQFTPTRQRNFLGALRSLETEAGRRVCLSIARGLYKVDPAAAGKLLITTLRELHPAAAFDPAHSTRLRRLPADHPRARRQRLGRGVHQGLPAQPSPPRDAVDT